MADILDYLQLEADPDAPAESDLKFIRTALVELGASWMAFWIWRFVDSDENECFVTVSYREAEREITVGYEVNWDGLTAEQYMFGQSRGWI